MNCERRHRLCTAAAAVCSPARPGVARRGPAWPGVAFGRGAAFGRDAATPCTIMGS